jgi:hypothetical protein
MVMSGDCETLRDKGLDKVSEGGEAVGSQPRVKPGQMLYILKAQYYALQKNEAVTCSASTQYGIVEAHM